MALFGSNVRGASQPGSEIDVLLSLRVIGAERWGAMGDFSIYQNVQQETARPGLEGDQVALASI